MRKHGIINNPKGPNEWLNNLVVREIQLMAKIECKMRILECEA